MNAGIAPSTRLRFRGACRKRQRGGETVEFALVGGVFLLVLFGIADWAHLHFANLTMQHAVREGARYAVVGRTDLAPDPTSATLLCDAAVQRIREQSVGFFDKVEASVVFKTVQLDGTITSLGSGSCYGARDIIIVEVSCVHDSFTVLRPFFPDGEYRFRVSTTMRNEDFEES